MVSAVWFVIWLLFIGMAIRVVLLVTLVALRADIVLTRWAVVLPVAIVVPEIAAVISAGVPVPKIAVVIVATSIVRVIPEAFAAIVAAYGAAIVELAGARRRRDVRATVIEVGELRAIVAGFVAMLHLVAGCVEVAIMVGELLFTIRASIDAATAAIEADAVSISVEMVIDAAVVNVADYVYVDAIDGAVVEELATAPFAAEETDARITETV